MRKWGGVHKNFKFLKKKKMWMNPRGRDLVLHAYIIPTGATQQTPSWLLAFLARQFLLRVTEPPQPTWFFAASGFSADTWNCCSVFSFKQITQTNLVLPVTVIKTSCCLGCCLDWTFGTKSHRKQWKHNWEGKKNTNRGHIWTLSHTLTVFY